MQSLNSYCVLSTTSPHFTLRATAEETEALNLRTLLSHKRWEPDSTQAHLQGN